MITTYHRAIVPHNSLTDEQARLVLHISSKLSPQDSMQFLAEISDQIRRRADLTDDQLNEIITTELMSLG